MNFNTDSEFIGIGELKRIHGDQIAEFEIWASQNDWQKYHKNHYDWWVFPVDRSSSYGLKYTVYEGDVTELKKDKMFLENYVAGVDLVSASWGWDLFNKTYMANPHEGQRWHSWPIRLYKAAQSVQLFGYGELFDSLKMYACDLINQGERMTYGGKDLSLLFRSG